MFALWFLLACFASVPPLAVPDPSAKAIDISVEDFTKRYLRWTRSHPNANLKLLMPTIDLYSPSGTLIYYGANSSKNAAFINGLPQSIGGAKTVDPRPSLQEVIEMFPEFKLRVDSLIADKRYTLVAITYPDWDRCKEQNEAVGKLPARRAQIPVQVLEVRLHQ